MRFEYKYLIPTSFYGRIKKELTPFLTLNKFAAQRETKDYTVRSIYFDTLLWKYYFEKIEGTKVRNKLRIRGYNDQAHNQLVYLEIKKKNGPHGSKSRFPILYEDLNTFFESGKRNVYLHSLESENHNINNARSFLYHFINEGLRPTMLVTYERETYYYKFGKELNIAFDKNLRYLPTADISHLFTNENLIHVFPGKTIIEIKFCDTYPNWLREILSQYNLQRLALSKYVLCKNHMDRDPINKFKKYAVPNLFQLNFE